jgi:glycosyltransferase involved in cell wall biosynthesis
MLFVALRDGTGALALGEDDRVSVVMPVRNAMPFLDEAVASILAQTHRDFELVIGDDGSTDGSGERLREWAGRDSRIRLLRGGGGLGPAGSANWVAGEARHALVARMDADDISMPDRLRRQIEALRAHPDAVLAGTLYECIDAKGKRVSRRDRSVLTNARCVFPVAHGSILFRRDAFARVGGYRRQCDYWEDVDFFIRMGREGRILILPEAHYRYRYSPTSARILADETQVARALDLGVRCLDAYRAGRDYEGVLEEDALAPRRGPAAPSVLALVALERLWRGDPRSIFSWARRHASFGRDRRGAALLALASWAWISPGSLRAFLSLRSRLADSRARHAVADGLVHIWRG